MLCFNVLIEYSYRLPEHKNDAFVKTPSTALCCIFRHCGVPVSTPHSSRFARLISGTFPDASDVEGFHKIIDLSSFLDIGHHEARNSFFSLQKIPT